MDHRHSAGALAERLPGAEVAGVPRMGAAGDLQPDSAPGPEAVRDVGQRRLDRPSAPPSPASRREPVEPYEPVGDVDRGAAWLGVVTARRTAAARCPAAPRRRTMSRYGGLGVCRLPGRDTTGDYWSDRRARCSRCSRASSCCARASRSRRMSTSKSVRARSRSFRAVSTARSALCSAAAPPAAGFRGVGAALCRPAPGRRLKPFFRALAAIRASAARMRSWY